MKKVMIGLAVIVVLLVIAHFYALQNQNWHARHPLVFTAEELAMIELNQEIIDSNNEIITPYLRDIGLDLGERGAIHVVRRLGALNVERIEQTIIYEQNNARGSIVRIKDDTGTFYYLGFSALGTLITVWRDERASQPIWTMPYH